MLVSFLMKTALLLRSLKATSSFATSSRLSSRPLRTLSHGHHLSVAFSSFPSPMQGTKEAPSDTSSARYKYWNREESEHGKYAVIVEDMVKCEARIISLSDPNDGANVALHQGKLPTGAKLLGVGTKLEDFDNDLLKKEQPNVVFVSPSCPMARVQLPILLNEYPSLEWIHARSAGIDFVVSQELADSRAYVTNAKGQFSSTLAEYTMMACSSFAKDLPRLLQQKKEKNWKKFDVQELRGGTMGIVGYGDIGTYSVPNRYFTMYYAFSGDH